MYSHIIPTNTSISLKKGAKSTKKMFADVIRMIRLAYEQESSFNAAKRDWHVGKSKAIATAHKQNRDSSGFHDSAHES